MLHSPLSQFRHKFFFSMNNRDDAQSLPNFYATNIENWIIRNVGQIEMRDGLTAAGVSPNQSNLGSAVLYRANGVKVFVRVIDGAGNTAKFQMSTDMTTWTDIGGGGSKTTGAIWHFAQANNYLYAVNGYDTPIRFDATTITNIAGIPNGTAIFWWRNFLWVFGVISIPDRLYFSNANDPETFGGTSYVNVNLGDQSPGVGLYGMGGGTPRLFIGKKYSVWFLTGSSSSDFAIAPLTYEHGVISHESMIAVKNEIWCIDAEGNVRGLYRSGNDAPFSNIQSSEIQATVAGLNRASLYKSTAVFFNNFAMFFVPNGVDDYNSLVLVFDVLANNGKGGWITFTGWRIARATVFTDTQPKLYLHDARSGNGQTYQWTGTSDNNTAILARYETKVYDHGYPANQKVFKFADQFGPIIGNVTSRFSVSIDRFYYTQIASPNLAGTGNKLIGVNWVLGVDKLGSGGFVKYRMNYSSFGGQNTGYTQQVKLEAESSTVKIKLREFTSYYRVKGLQ